MQKVKLLQSIKGSVQAVDILGAGSEEAALIPYCVPVTEQHRRFLLRFWPDQTPPSEINDPMLVYAPGRFIHLSTAQRMGTVVDADTMQPI